ncbi:unnamed protein product [Vitrella brassicaformis CCMP3155]|uniref:assimilatory sulfite reductase (NADPH) n=1 Tax=Vitrella brassicaformis (strain CCMP3155) TaxID=1169540 RepID=A0A0G4GUI4_VITBC|nr:unnamed protein product [Vitrella brassicaformis CCMP3155]|eukprot:CEM34472.1 unnamed protein product [Vitrella brassicaformis CCMP3155]
MSHGNAVASLKRLFDSSKLRTYSGRVSASVLGKATSKHVHWAVISRSEDAALSSVQAVASAKDTTFNVLITDNLASYRQDLALLAMEYGTAFVAAVASDATDLQMTRALTQAADYDGPSIVLVGGDVSFRWDPSAEAAGRDPFCVDAGSLPEGMSKFLERESQLNLLIRAHPDLKDKYVQKLPAGHPLLEASLAKLRGGLAEAQKVPLLIVYGSDGGNAEGLAKRLAKEAKARGADNRCVPMDTVEPPQLKGEKNVVAVVCTAGQGEFPGNAKKLWTGLCETEPGFTLDGVSFAVFALGDRHYWPDPQYFCKAGRDLDSRLEHLGAHRLLPCGIGDDQDTDKYEDGWGKWEPEFWKTLGLDRVGAVEQEEAVDTRHPTDEEIKIASRYLRGSLKDTLDDVSTGCIPYEDTKVIKFHGIYQQDHREMRSERAKLGIEKAFSFMARVRLPGGLCEPHQWLAMDELSSQYGNETLKVTTRQTFQLHGIIKRNLKTVVRGMAKACMDCIAACGDVNRNVICTSTPGVCPAHTYYQIQAISKELSEFVLPRTSAYYEIFLDEGGGEGLPSKLVAANTPVEEEPLYGKTYLPRKFKVAVAIPPVNDVDVFAHCVGFIAIIEKGELQGFTVTVGGGMGATNNDPATFPRTADVMGFCKPDDAKHVLAAIMAVQRDHGDRTNRKHARLKYTVDDHGVDWFRTQVEKELGRKLEKARPFSFKTRGDSYGWAKTDDGKWHYTMFIEHGRVVDLPDYKLKTAIRHLASVHKGNFRLTCNQNLTISNISDADKGAIKALLDMYGVDNSRHSALRLNSVACVALPTCPLAFAEAERYLPDLVTKLDSVMDECGLHQDEITIRMTGCPNGCARPYLAEIAFVGRSPGYYNLLLGGDFEGHRLNKVYREGVNEEEILQLLTPILKTYAKDRTKGESFGDFVMRWKSLWETASGSTPVPPTPTPNGTHMANGSAATPVSVSA